MLTAGILIYQCAAFIYQEVVQSSYESVVLNYRDAIPIAYVIRSVYFGVPDGILTMRIPGDFSERLIAVFF